LYAEDAQLLRLVEIETLGARRRPGGAAYEADPAAGWEQVQEELDALREALAE